MYMIGFVRGTIYDLTYDNVILDVAGVGYNVMITAKDAGDMPGVGSEVRIHTYLSVREDAMKLYGFLSKAELDFFKMLICVNGVGPKVAQGILAVMGPDELRMAILAGDSKTIAKCPGIGAKTAQRIIIDLKDKMDIEESLAEASTISHETEGTSDNMHEATQALVALGFSATETMAALRKVENAKDMDTEALIKAALKHLNAF